MNKKTLGVMLLAGGAVGCGNLPPGVEEVKPLEVRDISPVEALGVDTGKWADELQKYDTATILDEYLDNSAGVLESYNRLEKAVKVLGDLSGNDQLTQEVRDDLLFYLNGDEATPGWKESLALVFAERMEETYTQGDFERELMLYARFSGVEVSELVDVDSHTYVVNDGENVLLFSAESGSVAPLDDPDFDVTGATSFVGRFNRDNMNVVKNHVEAKAYDRDSEAVSKEDLRTAVENLLYFGEGRDVVSTYGMRVLFQDKFQTWGMQSRAPDGSLNTPIAWAKLTDEYKALEAAYTGAEESAAASDATGNDKERLEKLGELRDVALQHYAKRLTQVTDVANGVINGRGESTATLVTRTEVPLAYMALVADVLRGPDGKKACPARDEMGQEFPLTAEGLTMRLAQMHVPTYQNAKAGAIPINGKDAPDFWAAGYMNKLEK